MTSPLFRALQDRDAEAIAHELAVAARFRSPVRDYEGRLVVAHLLELIAEVLDCLRPTRGIAGASTWTTFFDSEVAGRRLQGVLDERRDDGGEVVEATLMLRPLGNLQLAVDAMRDALVVRPLPGRAS